MKPSQDEAILSHVRGIVAEAKQLLSQHDGVHSMHGCCAGISCGLYNLEKGLHDEPRPDDFYNPIDNMDYLIREMRFCHITGSFPKKHQRPKKRNLTNWLHVGCWTEDDLLAVSDESNDN